MQANSDSTAIPIEQTELQTWFERDRAHVALCDKNSDGDAILEFWDEDVAELVEDGFLNPRDWHGSLYEYAAYLGVLPGTEAGAL
ncbi:MAG: hypothetical protein WA765_16200 [Candidatus Acidiferrum sp.]